MFFFLEWIHFILKLSNVIMYLYLGSGIILRNVIDSRSYEKLSAEQIPSRERVHIAPAKKGTSSANMNWWIWKGYVSFQEGTLPKTNIAPENCPSQKETMALQPSIFRCYVSFPEGNYSSKFSLNIWVTMDDPFWSASHRSSNPPLEYLT